MAEENVEIRIIGAGGGVYSTLDKDKSMTSFLVTSQDAGILLDAGYGTLTRAMKMRIDLAQINVIFVSHLHVDHCLDVPVVTHARYRFAKNKSLKPKPLKIYCPAGYKEIFWVASEQLGDGEFRPECENIFEFLEGPQNSDVIKTAEVFHAPDIQSLAISCVVGQKVIVYTGDLKNDPRNFQIIAGLTEPPDLLITEATETKTTENWHLDILGALELYTSCGAKRMLIGHTRTERLPYVLGPNAQFIIAKDGMVLTL
jgi:ribonuclease BN (tRNA processing enzyme)